MLAALLAGALAFGPADPLPPRAATCFDAAADTIAIGRETADGWVIETSTADGPWQPVIGPIEVTAPRTVCPVLAAAPDGTAVVAADSPDLAPRVAIRPPGGAFGAPTTLPGGKTTALKVAAAPGGHVAVLWGPKERKPRKVALTALVAAPGRPTTRTVLTRSGTIEQVDLSLAADGTATASWNALDPLRKRISTFRAGRWGAAADLVPADPKGWDPSGTVVAVAPSGRRLLAWKVKAGVRIQVDGEPPVDVPSDEYSAAFAAALADDGSAIVTFMDDGEELVAVDRGPGGAWSAPHALPRVGFLPDISFREDERLGQQIDLAPGGQAVVSWTMERGRVVAVQGQAGGAWDTTGSLLSSPVRYASDPKLAGGRIVWLEPDGWGRPGALRGARLGAPLPADTTAPEFTATSPAKVVRKRSRFISVPITVHCSEACDAFSQFEGVEDYAARTIPAGASVTFQVPSYFPPGRKAFRFKLPVRVADRAGNERHGTVAVRVVKG